MKDATASGLVRSSIVARSVKKIAAVEAELGRVLLLERGVGFEDADDLHVLAGLRGFEEPRYVPVHQAGNRELQRRTLRRLCRRGADEPDRREQQRQEQVCHGVALYRRGCHPDRVVMK